MREAVTIALEMAAERSRTRLIHAYFDVDLDIVWTTVTDGAGRNRYMSVIRQYRATRNGDYAPEHEKRV